ncbi:DUF1223 domain-containing protein [Nevskia ramosa]|uniref:DUF1223 domain-containing protein n=1 Tax=Nevskia ramosa TaxID=64002 RepID=UPI003D0A1DD1
MNESPNKPAARPWLRCASTALISSLALAPLPRLQAAESSATARPVLVELFTSQGCSSCPPADAVLRELAGRSDVLALGFHVDYWDYLGWADPFASPQFTARQQGYARRQGWQVYTPQLVIDGDTALVGSRRGAAEDGIDSARKAQRSVPAQIVRDGAGLRLTVGKTEADDAAGEVWLLSFDAERSTDIARGENGGRRIVYPNVVRSLRKLGDWRNEPLDLRETLKPDERGERLALVVQDRLGQVWAVAATGAVPAR